MNFCNYRVFHDSLRNVTKLMISLDFGEYEVAMRAEPREIDELILAPGLIFNLGAEFEGRIQIVTRDNIVLELFDIPSEETCDGLP